MGLLSKLKSSSKDARPGASSTADANEIVRDARARARRRLIGAALLLGVGIIGFPLLFETQPRPIAVDIPIEIPSRENAPALVSPASRPARSQPVAKPPVEPPTTMAAQESLPKPVVAAKPPEPKPEAKADTKPAAKPAEPPKPEPKPEAKPATKPAEAPKPAEVARNGDSARDDEGRFVVQVGAFAEAGSAREARMKVEGMGLKTYTQVIESDSGRRIRVRTGPYATKAEADKAAAKIKSGGLQAAVLKL
ncbi:MAG TPA: SPOR domain-containing protein [Ideonella sp.]|uniref:SPOR domain-containing protein n=1 Tax=Ideonella sp. TaxID=1929293 RepID=UPI002E36D753|nr:SPOR domain-containing protein [Ideonella sp.]HEX5686547.1 SPOR domain-containing protein [Ideonella sp.]